MYIVPLLKGSDMELLIVVAMNLANELRSDKQESFIDFERQPDTCFELIKELQTRIQGYELSDYIKAMTYAINSQRSLSQ
jgi:hypothetical protein